MTVRVDPIYQFKRSHTDKNCLVSLAYLELSYSEMKSMRNELLIHKNSQYKQCYYEAGGFNMADHGRIYGSTVRKSATLIGQFMEDILEGIFGRYLSDWLAGNVTLLSSRSRSGGAVLQYSNIPKITQQTTPEGERICTILLSVY